MDLYRVGPINALYCIYMGCTYISGHNRHWLITMSLTDVTHLPVLIDNPIDLIL